MSQFDRIKNKICMKGNYFKTKIKYYMKLIFNKTIFFL